MGRLSRPQIKSIVKSALKEVADFNGEFEQFTFDQFHEFHKKVFLSSLKRNLNLHPYHKNDGSTGKMRYYDISLNEDLFDRWNSMQDCISYLLEDHAEFQTGNREKLNL